MATMELTRENFESVVDDSRLVLVDFWAGRCGPRRMFAPVFLRVSELHPDAVFGKVDTEAQPELAGSFGSRAREIDMDEVRASLAAGAASAEGQQRARS
jgi:thiol-disulfide isomerase/thioredoxin